MAPVCEKVLDSAASVVCACDVPLDILMHFISTFPWEFTGYGGMLYRARVLFQLILYLSVK